MSWTTIHTTDFSGIGNTAAVGAGLELADGWIDVIGNTWSIASSQLVGTTTSTGSLRCLLRPSSENVQNERVVADFDASLTGAAGAVLRRVSAGNHYLALFNPSSSQLTLQKVVGGSTSALTTSASLSPAYNSAHQYRLDFSAEGVSPTTLTATLTDLDTDTVVASTTFGDSSAPLQSAGQVGVLARSISGSSNSVFGLEVTTYSSALDPGVLELDSSTPTQAVVDLDDSGMVGVGTISHKLYFGATPDFAPGVGTLLADPATFPYAHAVSQPGSYKVVSSDDEDTVTSNPMLYSPWLPPIKIGFIGDSITQEGTPISVACSLLGTRSRSPRIVTSVNAGVIGSYSAQWVDGSTNLDDALAAFTLAGGVDFISIMLGTNDANVAATADDFYENMTSLVGACLAVAPVVLHYPIGTLAEARNALLLQYAPKIDQICEETGAFLGDTNGLYYFTQHSDELDAGGVHPGSTGKQTLGKLWADAIDQPTEEEIARAAWSFAGGRTVTA